MKMKLLSVAEFLVTFIVDFDLDNKTDTNLLRQDTKALEELSRQLFLESVDLHNEQVNLLYM